MIDLKQDVQYVKGVGPNNVALLQKLSIHTLEDLITFFPRNYEDRSKPKKINELVDGEEALIDVICASNVMETRFATEEEINENMPLEINPKPDTIIRILMTYKGLDEPIDVEEQKLITPERNGFVVVEWGGTEIK